MNNYMKLSFFILIFSASMVFLLLTKNQYNTENISSSVENSSFYTSSDSEYKYTLKAIDGKLVAFKENVLYKKYDISVNSLPEYDRELLENGIGIETMQELQSLIEDYES